MYTLWKQFQLKFRNPSSLIPKEEVPNAKKSLRRGNLSVNRIVFYRSGKAKGVLNSR